MPKRPLSPEGAMTAHAVRNTADGWRKLREIADAWGCYDGEAIRRMIDAEHARHTQRTRAPKENHEG
jgi:hypothetical protein